MVRAPASILQERMIDHVSPRESQRWRGVPEAPIKKESVMPTTVAENLWEIWMISCKLAPIDALHVPLLNAVKFPSIFW